MLFYDISSVGYLNFHDLWLFFQVSSVRGVQLDVKLCAALDYLSATLKDSSPGTLQDSTQR